MWGRPTAPTQWDPLPLEYCRVRKLIPNLEHVTWREPTVTPSDLAISSREIPSATQSLIFWMLAGVYFVAIRPLVLLCHKFWCPFRAAQHGQRESVVARAATNLRRIVAIEFGTWRSGRNGGSSGLVTFA